MILTETKFEFQGQKGTGALFEFRGQKGTIALDEYSLGGTCLLFLAEGEDLIGGSLVPLSVRIPGRQPSSRNQVYIKDYSELNGILFELERQGIIKPEKFYSRVRISPWVSAPLVTLSDEISKFLPFSPSFKEESK